MASVIEQDKERKIDARYNLSVYFSLLRRYLPLLCLGLFIIFFMEALQVVDKYLFKVLIDGSTQFDGKTLVVTDFVRLLLGLAAVYLLVILIRAGANWLRIHVVNTLEAKMILDVKRRFFDHILHLSHHFHTTHKTGSLISRLIRGGGAIERMTDVILFNMSPLVFQLTIVSIALFAINRITAVVIFITIACFISYAFIIQRYQQRQHRVANMTEDREKAYVSDVFTNIDSIKYFGKERTIIGRFHALTHHTRQAYLRAWSYWRWLDAGQNFIVGLGTFFLLYFTLDSFLQREITLGTLVFIYTLYGNLMPPLYGFVHGMRNFYRAMVDFEDLFQYGKITNDILDKPHAPSLKIRQGSVEFRNLTFKYHKTAVLHDFTLKIKPHEKIALVGHSGSGKSTVVKLLYRLYDVQQGAILIDGKNIKDVQQESLRNELSIVPQECILFDDTIYNNIAFSNPSASRHDVWQAIRFAQLDNTIAMFPSKEHTIVGERGVKLSGGEKQRVSLARALLANRKILILDEATSSLDSQTEHDIQQDLRKLMQGRTVIIIAHRLSTIMHADTIVVLDKGRIIQIGSHHALIKKKGKYQTLWKLQRGGYIK